MKILNYTGNSKDKSRNTNPAQNCEIKKGDKDQIVQAAVRNAKQAAKHFLNHQDRTPEDFLRMEITITPRGNDISVMVPKVRAHLPQELQDLSIPTFQFNPAESQKEEVYLKRYIKDNEEIKKIVSWKLYLLTNYADTALHGTAKTLNKEHLFPYYFLDNLFEDLSKIMSPEQLISMYAPLDQIKVLFELNSIHLSNDKQQSQIDTITKEIMSSFPNHDEKKALTYKLTLCLRMLQDNINNWEKYHQDRSNSDTDLPFETAIAAYKDALINQLRHTIQDALMRKTKTITEESAALSRRISAGYLPMEEITLFLLDPLSPKAYEFLNAPSSPMHIPFEQGKQITAGLVVTLNESPSLKRELKDALGSSEAISAQMSLNPEKDEDGNNMILRHSLETQAPLKEGTLHNALQTETQLKEMRVNTELCLNILALNPSIESEQTQIKTILLLRYLFLIHQQEWQGISSRFDVTLSDMPHMPNLPRSRAQSETLREIAKAQAEVANPQTESVDIKDAKTALIEPLKKRPDEALEKGTGDVKGRDHKAADTLMYTE